MRPARRFAVFGLGTLGVFVAFASACGGGGTSSSSMGPGDAAIDRARLSQPFHPDAACLVTVDTPPLLTGAHVPEGTPITWSSNPPSSGTHYPVWANYQEFSTAVDLGYLVHCEEHGGVVLFYKCEDGASCDAIVQGLRQVRDALPTDPECDPSIRVRVVIVPDPLLDVPVAAAAWGWTYKADCIDVPSLTDFARAHYGQGTEDTCAEGLKTF